MSHFLVAAIVKDTENIDEVLEKMMASYSENLAVEPYQEECWCVGNFAKKEIFDQLDKKFGKIQDVKNKFWEKINRLPQVKKDQNWRFSKEGEKYTDREWKKLMKPRFDAEELLKESHPDINKADVDCEDCNGTGKVMSTYNPKSKWDWYVIGGRWDGMIKNDSQKSTDNGFNFGDEHHKSENNVISVKDYLAIALKHPEKVIPFAIVTPEGEWCERGKMGWWAIVSNEKDEEKWLYEAIKIVQKYPDYYVVGLDCHI